MAIVNQSTALNILKFDDSTGTLIVQPPTGNSNDIQQWKNSTGTSLVSIGSDGTIRGGGSFLVDGTYGITNIRAATLGGSLNVGTGYALQQGIIVRGAASQSANLQEWQNSAGGVLTWIDSAGNFKAAAVATSRYISDINSTTPYLDFSSNKLVANSRNASYVAFIVQGSASQTANLQEWQDSSGNQLARLQPDGHLVASYLSSLGSVNAAGTLRAGSTTSSYGGQLQVTSTNASNIGIIIRGATSQTANLEEWQNSSGSVLARVDKDGFMYSSLFSSAGNVLAGYQIIGGRAQTQLDGSAVMGMVNWNASYYTLQLRNASSQTADSLRIENSSGTVLSKVDSSGNITAPSYNLSNSLYNLRKTIKKSVGDGQTVAANTTYDLFDFAFPQSLQGTFYIQVSIRGSGYGQNLTFSVPTTYVMDWLGQGYSGNLFTNSSTWVSLTPLTFSGRHLMVGDDLKVQLKVSANTLSMRLKTTAQLTGGGGSPYFDIYIQHSEEFANCNITEYSSIGTDSTSQSTLANFLSSKGGTTELFNPTTIFSNSASNIPLKIKGAASQSADLQQWQNSSGTSVTTISPNGALRAASFYGSSGLSNIAIISSNALGVNPSSASTVGFIIRGVSSQTANLQEWQDSSGYTSVYVRADGYLYSNYGMGTSGSFNAGSWISGIQLSSNISNPSTKGLVVRGATSQTANLTEWQDSTGTILASMSPSGAFSAVTKSFVIKHPFEEGKLLRYGSLEGPENGVYVRGKIDSGNIIDLPDYWTALVDESTITVNITPIGSSQNLYVEEIKDNKIYVAGGIGAKFFYTVFAERKDVAKLVVEE